MSAPPRSLRILLVEDDDAVRRVAVLALERVGKETVLACARGAEALARVDGFAPDIVLLDVMMPELDGPQTLAALRERAAWATVPVVFLTAKVSPEETEALRALGAAGVLAKPFEPMRLAAQVRAIYAETCAAAASTAAASTAVASTAAASTAEAPGAEAPAGRAPEPHAQTGASMKKTVPESSDT